MATENKLSISENLQSAEYLALKYLIEEIEQLKTRVTELEVKEN